MPEYRSKTDSSKPPEKKRQRLSQAVILKSAVKLIQNDGVDRLSFRRLAEQLGVTPMAIYRHFENKDALLSALLDQFIRAADVLPEDSLPWDQWIMYVGQRMWKAQVNEPEWLALLGSVRISSGGLGVMVESLEVLKDAGFSSQDAFEAFFTMAHISVGAACISLGLQKLDLSGAFDAEDVSNLQKLETEYGGVQQALVAQQVGNSLRLLVEGLASRR